MEFPLPHESGLGFRLCLGYYNAAEATLCQVQAWTSRDLTDFFSLSRNPSQTPQASLPEYERPRGRETASPQLTHWGTTDVGVSPGVAEELPC